jgi:hypothetical protein
MPRAEVWVRTDTKIIRADTIRAVGWSPHAEAVLLELVASGEKQPLTIRVQPDLPRYFVYDEGTGKTGDDQRHEAYQAAWERAGGLDEGLLRAIANAAKIPGGAVVLLGHDDEDFPGQWEIEPLASGTPAPE